MDPAQIPSTGIHWLDVSLYILGCVSAVATAAASLPFVPAKVAGVATKIGVSYIPAILSFIGSLFRGRKPDPNALTPTDTVAPEADKATAQAAGAAASAASKGPFTKG